MRVRLPTLAPAAHHSWRAMAPVCTAAASSPAAAVMNQAQQSLQSIGAAAITVSTAKNGAAFWQLSLAFVSGGLFVATVIAALTLAYTLGATNVAKAKAMLRVAVGRTWDITISVLGAASYALFRRNVPGAPCVETDESCEAENVSRWREAWLILREGIRRVRSTASEGVAALSAELKLSSAAFGVPGLVGFQYLVDKPTPLRLENELEKARSSP